MDFPYFEKPIFDKEQDYFDFDTDARNKANSILQLPLHETYTIAVYGKWGSGKTSYVNLILNYIQEAINFLGEKIVVVKFDTSLFQNSNDLISEFYKQIFFALKKDKKLKKQRNIKKILTTFSEYAYFISSTLEPISKIELPAKIGSSIFSFFTKKNLNDSTLGEKRKELEDKLLKSKYRFIIVIDDIDRLQRKQAKSVFRLIYTISRLPNHTFILPMDKEIVSKSIHNIYGIDGDGYLEKIVQLELNVPPIAKNQLKDFLFGKIQDLFHKDYSYDATYKEAAYEYCISQIVNTPRDVNRLSSHFIFQYNALQDDVNPIDYLIIVTLNLYFPKLYSLIHANRHDLCEHDSSRGSSEFSPEKKREHEEKNHIKLIKVFQRFGIKEKDYSLAETMLGFLFPETTYNFGINLDFNLGIYQRSLAGRYICIKEFFDSYFAFEHSAHNLSKSEINSILETDDEMNISRSIIDSLEDNTFNQLIDSIDTINTELSQERINVISSALFMAYDSLCIKNEYKLYDGKYFTPNVLKEISNLFDSFYRTSYNKDKVLSSFLKEQIKSSTFSKTYLAISNVLIIQKEYLRTENSFASIRPEEKLMDLVNLYFSELFSLPTESIRLFNDLCDSTFKLFLYYIEKRSGNDNSFEENMKAMNNLLSNKENLFKFVKQLIESWANCGISSLSEFRDKNYPNLTKLDDAIPVIKEKLSELEKEPKENDGFTPLMNQDIEICRAFLDVFDKEKRHFEN